MFHHLGIGIDNNLNYKTLLLDISEKANNLFVL